MRLAVFDLDHTLIHVNSSFRFYFFLCRRNIYSHKTLLATWRYYLRYRLGLISPFILHQEIFAQFLMGRRAQEFEMHVQDFWQENLFRFLQPTVLRCLKLYQQAKDYVLLLSNAPHFLLGPVAHFLNFDDYQGSQYMLDKKKCYRQIALLMDGDQKAKTALSICNKLGLTPEKMVVYTDSIWDKPLMEVAGDVVLVNPDRKLRLLAPKRKWSFLHETRENNRFFRRQF